MNRQQFLKSMRYELEEDLGGWCPEDVSDVEMWSTHCVESVYINRVDLKKYYLSLSDSQQNDVSEEIDDIIEELSESVVEDLTEE